MFKIELKNVLNERGVDSMRKESKLKSTSNLMTVMMMLKAYTSHLIKFYEFSAHALCTILSFHPHTITINSIIIITNFDVLSIQLNLHLCAPVVWLCVIVDVTMSIKFTPDWITFLSLTLVVLSFLALPFKFHNCKRRDIVFSYQHSHFFYSFLVLYIFRLLLLKGRGLACIKWMKRKKNIKKNQKNLYHFFLTWEYCL